MTTDQMILALVQRHGFKLPEGLRRLNEHWHHVWPVNHSHVHRVSPQAAHDLCAMEFARQACRDGTWSYELSAALCAGDSTAALKALYDAMEAK